MPIGTNPLASASMGGAAGDLGVSNAVSAEAKAIADKLKKKKQQDAANNASTGVPGSAVQDLFNGTF